MRLSGWVPAEPVPGWMSPIGRKDGWAASGFVSRETGEVAGPGQAWVWNGWEVPSFVEDHEGQQGRRWLQEAHTHLPPSRWVMFEEKVILWKFPFLPNQMEEVVALIQASISLISDTCQSFLLAKKRSNSCGKQWFLGRTNAVLFLLHCMSVHAWVCVCARSHVCMHFMCGGQRAACNNAFLSSHTQKPRNLTQVGGLSREYLYLLSHFASPDTMLTWPDTCL